MCKENVANEEGRRNGTFSVRNGFFESRKIEEIDARPCVCTWFQMRTGAFFDLIVVFRGYKSDLDRISPAHRESGSCSSRLSRERSRTWLWEAALSEGLIFFGPAGLFFLLFHGPIKKGHVLRLDHAI